MRGESTDNRSAMNMQLNSPTVLARLYLLTSLTLLGFFIADLLNGKTVQNPSLFLCIAVPFFILNLGIQFLKPSRILALKLLIWTTLAAWVVHYTFLETSGFQDLEMRSEVLLAIPNFILYLINRNLPFVDSKPSA